MASNTLRVHASLSFKGEHYQLDTVVDLDRTNIDAEEMPDFHRILAGAHGIDTYSYLYEALESNELEFSEPTGAAAQACQDGGFDWVSFAQARREELDWQVVRNLAAQTLNPTDLDARADLKAMLLAVYRAGRASAG